MHDYGNVMRPHLRDAADVLRGKSTAITAYRKKQEKPQISDLTPYLREPEK